MTSFAVHVHQLAQPHLSHGEHHQPLLTRLRNATTPGSDGGKAGGEGGRPVPANLSAVDLFCKIETAARNEYRLYRGFVYVGQLENLLRDLIGTPWTELPEDWDDYLAGKASEWIDEILGLLHPAKPRRRLHRPCPACGVKYHGKDRLPALTMNAWDEHEDMMHAPLTLGCLLRCVWCGVAW